MFFRKKWVWFRAASPTQSVKSVPNFLFFPIFSKDQLLSFLRLFNTLSPFGCGLEDTLEVVFAENTPSTGVGSSGM